MRRDRADMAFKSGAVDEMDMTQRGATLPATLFV